MEAVTDTIIVAASVLGAVCAIGAAVLAVVKWFLKQEKQTEDINSVRELHKNDMKIINDELCMLSYAMLAALDGLKQLHCNGEVTKAHDKLEKHLNQKAHGQNSQKP